MCNVSVSYLTLSIQYQWSNTFHVVLAVLVILSVLVHLSVQPFLEVLYLPVHPSHHLFHSTPLLLFCLDFHADPFHLLVQLDQVDQLIQVDKCKVQVLGKQCLLRVSVFGVFCPILLETSRLFVKVMCNMSNNYKEFMNNYN